MQKEHTIEFWAFLRIWQRAEIGPEFFDVSPFDYTAAVINGKVDRS